MQIFTLSPEEKPLAQKLGPLGDLEQRLFPDGESYLRVLSPVKNEDVAILCGLNQPNPKIPPLLFLAAILKQQGAKSITLIAPYLCYMRQDKIFNEGEGLMAQYCGKLLSPYFDHIITIDPHLHRIHSLNEIYTTKTTVLHAETALLHYIQANVKDPFIIGPDAESEQWISRLAQTLGCPYIITKKIRHGDHDVEIQPFEIDLADKTSIVIDDIASSGATLLEIYKKLPLRDKKPIALIIHGVFAPGVYERVRLLYEVIVTTNTVPHESNRIDISTIIKEALYS